MLTIETKATGEKWGLYVNGILIGDSKNRFDADHAVVMLKKALESNGKETNPDNSNF